MQSEYLALLVLMAIAALVCGVMVAGSYILGPKKITPYKQAPYECGVEPVGDARERFPIKFYLVGIIFILFDIEVVFLWGWMTHFLHAEPAFKIFSLWEFLIYMATFVVGYAYVIRVGAIDWDETTSIVHEPDALPFEGSVRLSQQEQAAIAGGAS